ncbi:MAG: hypothetical protein KJ732_01520 [Candidatus Margulisbacteria bacterium]|nr:hypothetical protein [Candidatus Margulisiibacteriota bacterium]
MKRYVFLLARCGTLLTFLLTDRLKRQRLPLPKKLPKVALLCDYAGSDGSFVRYAVDSGAEGIVVDAPKARLLLMLAIPQGGELKKYFANN